MTSPIAPFRLPILMALICLVIVWFILPTGLELWRKAICGILSVSLGYQIAAALRSTSKALRIQSWLECVAFPIVMVAFIFLPSLNGWILLGLGFGWRFLVRGLFRIQSN
jgi:hypothetical protein